MHSQLLTPPPTHLSTHPGSHLTRAHIHTHTPNFATAWRVMREPWHVLPRHLLLCQPRQGQPAGPYLATRAGAKRLSHERTRPPEACGHLWPYHSMNDSHIYDSVPVTWTHATRWHLLLQFLSNTNNRYLITPQSILKTSGCFRDLSPEFLQMCYFRLFCCGCFVIIIFVGKWEKLRNLPGFFLVALINDMYCIYDRVYIYV